jgi:hypothetical protein
VDVDPVSSALSITPQEAQPESSSNPKPVISGLGTRHIFIGKFLFMQDGLNIYC